MDPYDMLVEEYGSDAVQQYFVMRAVRKHAFSEKIRLMNRLAEQASSFKKGAVDVIEHKMKRVHGEYLTVLNDMEKQREGTRHMLEAHFRENI